MVMSRMVINRKAGPVTIFSFDENERHPEHTAPSMPLLGSLTASARSGWRGTHSR
jgi:hypothetical protein